MSIKLTRKQLKDMVLEELSQTDVMKGASRALSTAGIAKRVA